MEVLPELYCFTNISIHSCTGVRMMIFCRLCGSRIVQLSPLKSFIYIFLDLLLYKHSMQVYIACFFKPDALVSR